MTTLRNHQWVRVAAGAALVVFCTLLAPQLTHAQEGMSVTLTPPLFQLTIGPGESWTSSLKVVNNNTFPVTYYAEVVDMLPNGEDGTSKFIPLINQPVDAGEQTSALAHWIQLPQPTITIPPGESGQLPFSVLIPEKAEPGGHYAAILVGTQPNALHATGTVLKVASYVSSLLFVRIKGDVIESGRIREFTTTQNLYQSPNVDFTLRFENTGNTHVRPQGSITISNMWGKQRGQVLINQDADSNFGNVLPKSIRKFQFSWKGEGNPFDIGLYSAEVTLSYGQEGKQNVSSKVYFWVVPVVPVTIGAVTTLIFVLLFIFLVRRYIRRALTLEQQRFGSSTATVTAAPSIIETLIEPVREGVIDLRKAAGAKPQATTLGPSITLRAAGPAEDTEPTTLTMGQFILKYKLFFIFLLLLVIGSLSLWAYFDKVLLRNRGFQITDVHIQAEPLPTSSISTEK